MYYKGTCTEQSKVLTKRLIKRGYSENEVQQQTSNAFTSDRAYLLNQKNQVTSNKIPLILTYNRILPDIKRAVNKHWDTLKVNRDTTSFTKLP